MLIGSEIRKKKMQRVCVYFKIERVLFLILIDHNHLHGKMTYARPILLTIDLAAAGLLFLSTVAAGYALIALQLITII